MYPQHLCFVEKVFALLSGGLVLCMYMVIRDSIPQRYTIYSLACVDPESSVIGGPNVSCLVDGG